MDDTRALPATYPVSWPTEGAWRAIFLIFAALAAAVAGTTRSATSIHGPR
jgi:hypothetical protein